MNARVTNSWWKPLLAAACLLTFVPIAASAANLPSIVNPNVQAQIVAAVQRDRARFGGRTPLPAALVGVWDREGHAFVKAFGYADLAHKVPLTTADHFRIGSNTKTFVVSVLLQLVAEKRLSLDDPISRFGVGVTVPNGQNITVRELCDMRSGLFEAYDTPQFDKLNFKVPKNFSPRLLVEWAVAQKPYFAPNQGYHYSNTNYLLLGLIVESVTNDSIANQIRKRLLRPFGLKQTIFPQTEAMPEPWARGYTLDRNGNWEDVSNTVPVAITWSAGAMISDMNDIRRWIKLYATAPRPGVGP